MAVPKSSLCAYIEKAHKGGAQCEEVRGWKALLASDAMLFFNLRGGTDTSRRGLIAERLRLMEQGHWGVFWSHANHAQDTATQEESDRSVTVRRIEQLLEAGEQSRAASAVWGLSKGVEADKVRKQFMSTQAPPRGRQTRHAGAQDTPAAPDSVPRVIDEEGRARSRAFQDK